MMNLSEEFSFEENELYSKEYIDALYEQLKNSERFSNFNLSGFYNYSHELGDLHTLTSWMLSRPRQKDVWDYLETTIGPRRGPLGAVIAVTCVYGFIFLSGIFGNVCTCLVITKNKYMHTATNYYLCNLAIADLLLLVVGLPPETYSIWHAYPWIFGEVCCVARTLFAEMCTNASIFTITAFTIER